ncbi:MAG TPA: DUF167 domain-containing protein [Candidatus Nanoarchaeia archaeon]|nr:DUF167 domain-containing protein [Candidatus Nanoarchaeia archaeon]
MKIKIKVHSNSSQEKINKIDDHFYEVWLKEKPIDNKANLKIQQMLKKYFSCNVKIKSGFSSKLKTLELIA